MSTMPSAMDASEIVGGDEQPPQWLAVTASPTRSPGSRVCSAFIAVISHMLYRNELAGRNANRPPDPEGARGARRRGGR